VTTVLPDGESEHTPPLGTPVEIEALRDSEAKYRQLFELESDACL